MAADRAPAYASIVGESRPSNRHHIMFQRLVYRCALALLGLAALVQCSSASDYRETETFAPIVEQARTYAEKYGGENVLLVVDVDNTLLAMNRQLGSDQWFEWQEYLLEHEPHSPHLVADDFARLLEVQGILFATTGMHPPEREQPAHIATIQALGLDTVVLTSRGDEFRAATIRELERAGYDFGHTAPSIRLFEGNGQGGYETCSRFKPYKIDRPARYGLRGEEVDLFKLPDNPRQVSYGDGVLMTAGQHKGAMMLVFLHLVGREYDAVLYIDDHGRHVSRVYDALTRRGMEVTTYHYTHEDSRVRQFAYSDKARVTRQWQRIARALRYGQEERALATP